MDFSLFIYAAQGKMLIETLVWICCMNKKKNLIEDERKDEVQKPHTYHNPKRHIPLVSLLLWHKFVAKQCFLLSLSLRLWSVSGDCSQ